MFLSNQPLSPRRSRSIDRADVSLGLRLLNERLVGLTCSSNPGYDEVKAKGAEQLQTLDVALPITDPL